MRDIDREIGIGAFGQDTNTDDDRAVARNRRIGELLLLTDEMEETLETLRAQPAADPLQPGRSREDTLRALERRSRLERERLETLARREPIDYEAIARAMPMR